MSYYWFLGFMTAVVLLKGFSLINWLRDTYRLLRSASLSDISSNADPMLWLKEDMDEFYQLRVEVYARIMLDKNIRFAQRIMMMRDIYRQTRRFFEQKVSESLDDYNSL